MEFLQSKTHHNKLIKDYEHNNKITKHYYTYFKKIDKSQKNKKEAALRDFYFLVMQPLLLLLFSATTQLNIA